MNERIKEIWQQAADASAAYPSGQNNSWETQVNFMDKFAELIILECANVADDVIDNMPVDVEWPSYHVKKHFGVE